MARQTIETITATFTAAIAAGKMWNVDFVETREALGRLFDTADDDIRDAIEATMGRESAWELGGDFICSNYSNFAGRITRLEKKLVNYPEAVAAVHAVAAPFLTIIPLVVAVKPLVVKGRKPAENPSMFARTIDHTGTCGCCNRNIKMNDSGKMWDHGYTIDGRGHGYGNSYKNGNSCFGVGYEPIEVSPKVWQDMLVRMERNLASLPEMIKTGEAWMHANKRPDDPSFRDTPAPLATEYRKNWMSHASDLQGLRMELAHLKTAIPRMITNIAAWAPSRLPGTSK